MPLEVDYITLGDASARLEVPAPTLRHWTDQMEEFNVHFVLRNNRNERIYQDSDLKIFEFLRDLKEEYGRRTTTRDLGYMILDKGTSGELDLRTRDDVPPPSNPSNRTTDLLNQDDIKRIFESDRARQVLEYMVKEANNVMKADLIEEVRAEVREEIRQEIAPIKQNAELTNEEMMKLVKAHESLEQTIKESEKRAEERAIQRDENLMKSLRQTMDSKKGFFAKLFGK